MLLELPLNTKCMVGFSSLQKVLLLQTVKRSITQLTPPTWLPTWPRSQWAVQASKVQAQEILVSEHRTQQALPTLLQTLMLTVSSLTSWEKSLEFYARGMSYLMFWAKVLMVESTSQ